MRKIFKLAGMLLKSGGLFGGAEKKKSKSRWFLPILLGFAFLSFAASIGLMTWGLYQGLEQLGSAEPLLPLAFGATSAVIFLFGIFYVISVMYHADDIQLLLYLPLKPWEILGAKFLTLIVYEYIFEAFILVPMLVTYAIMASVGPLFIIYAVVLALATPIIALCIAAVIIMLVMRFTRFAKNKQAFNFISGIIAMVFAIGFNVVIQTSVRNVSESQLAAIANGQSPLVSMVEKIFPGTRFAAEALINSNTVTGLWNLLLFLLCSAAAVAIFLLLGQLLYFKGVAGVTETSAKRKAISAEALAKETEGSPVLWSYVRKEIRLLFRSPIAFMNCVLINFIWPLLLLFMMFTGSESMNAVQGLIAGLEPHVLLAIIVGMSAFVASSNAVTSSAISREGKTLYFMKYIPVSMKTQLTAKVLTGVVLSLIGIVLLCGLALYFGAPVLVAVGALLLSIPASVAAAVSGLLIDASRPKLEWSNEQQAIKQNMNVMLHMLVGVGLAAVIILPVILTPIGLVVSLIYIAAVCALLCAVLVRSVRGASKRLCAMDV